MDAACYYRQLLKSCKHITNADELKEIRIAFDFLVSGLVETEPFIAAERLHRACSIATILAGEMELPVSCIVAALIKDVPDTENNSAIRDVFDRDILGLIVQLNKIAGLHTERISIQAENFIQLLLALTNDIRVILIGLADRLFLMRSISNLPEALQRKISSETINLYTPLAHRLGLYKIKAELEELAMQHAYPLIYRSIVSKIEQTKLAQENLIREFIQPIEQELRKTKLSFEIKSRTKSIPSIWNKMKNQNVDFEQVYDLFAIRIITNSAQQDEKRDCWEIYSLVTNIYKPNASRMRDWISAPKSSGYESLHATVIGPQEKWIEVQIRSKRMDEDAEKGQAAHWKYKSAPANESEADQRLRNIRAKLESYTATEGDAESETQIQHSDNNVYIFTPQGDLKKLPFGATVLDFAFEIHTDVGSRCTGAKVNKSFVPLKHVLKTGDMVEIITSKTQRPSKDWLNIAITNKAKNKIKRHLKEDEFSQADTGRDILLRKFAQLKINNADEAIHKLVNYYKADNSLDLFHDIATEKIDIQKIKDILSSIFNSEEPKPHQKAADKKQKTPTITASKAIVIVNEETPLSDVKLAKCCHPVMGDGIFGFVTVTEGIKIHRHDCTNAREMHNRYSYRIVKARWADNMEMSNFLATIKVTGIDSVGILSTITSTLSGELNANTRSINIESKKGKFEGMITLNVSGRNHLEMIIARLQKIKDITRVIRIN